MMRRRDSDVQESLDKLEKYLSKRRTMADMTEKFDVHRVTIRTWIDRLINERGLDVRQDGLHRPEVYYLEGA